MSCVLIYYILLRVALPAPLEAIYLILVELENRDWLNLLNEHFSSMLSIEYFNAVNRLLLKFISDAIRLLSIASAWIAIAEGVPVIRCE